MVYEFRKGSRFSGDPEAIYKEIVSIGESRTPDQVVKKAKAVKSSMHRCFDWDDTAASTNWRRHQARQLMGSIIMFEAVVQEDEPEEPVIMRAFENVTTDGETGKRGYVTREQVIQTPDYAEEVKAELLAQIDSFENHLKTYEDVESLKRPVQEIRSRIRKAKELVTA